MFRKILIANRGEIACRIIRTAKAMGISTVAVYSEADAGSQHVEMADEAFLIGPAPAAQSYLVMERIVDVCRLTGAEAVHPGYGFLSERTVFAEELARNGIAFIGPNARAIDMMGDKIRSKEIASKAGVRVVPGAIAEIDDLSVAAKMADDIGYPVLIKASAGGGGKGMRIAHNASELSEGLLRSRSEAKASFGDDRVFLEKYIVNPRHIEVQVLGDKHGHVVHLFERECSIQRRHQKIIEESPSPLMDEETRALMGAQAVQLAQAVGYDSAGTVEFVADQERNFYFLEMNTRLQVEHPVTELVTGLDLVEWMIRVAAGEALGFEQKDLKIQGHAIECRICAEDPEKGFVPSVGRLSRYQPPAAFERGDGEVVRVDDGVIEGDEVSVYYDSMIAKLITHAESRGQATGLMRTALDRFEVAGLKNNIALLSDILEKKRWNDGALSTAFLNDVYPDGFAMQAPDSDLARVFAAISLSIHVLLETRRATLGGPKRAVGGWPADGRGRPMDGRGWSADGRLSPAEGAGRGPVHVVQVGERSYESVLRGDRDAGFEIELNSPRKRTQFGLRSHWRPGQPLWVGSIDGQTWAVHLAKTPMGYVMRWRGFSAEVQVLSQREAELRKRVPARPKVDTSLEVRSPMPGLVQSMAVSAGDSVSAGDVLLVIEAMKMENVIRSERDGVVKAVHAKAGDAVAVDALLVAFEKG
jgi:propionyl-CoA carboxylase alpha chain